MTEHLDLEVSPGVPERVTIGGALDRTSCWLASIVLFGLVRAITSQRDDAKKVE